ncbi:MAG: hypothetical protein AAF998_14410 [Bacteroidota bacterium]
MAKSSSGTDPPSQNILTMYAIIDKKTKVVLAEHPASPEQELQGTEVHPGFDPETMRLIKYDGPRLPEHYKISRSGVVTALSLEERAAKNLVQFDRNFSQKIDLDSELELSVELQAIRKALALNLITTEMECRMALDMLLKDQGEAIQQRYTPGYEAKIMKGCIEWLMDGRPSDDKREADYQEMKAGIAAIKAPYAETKAAIRQLLENQ